MLAQIGAGYSVSDNLYLKSIKLNGFRISLPYLNILSKMFVTLSYQSNPQ